MARVYRAAVIGCGAIGGLNDSLRDWAPGQPALSHAGAYRSCPATELVAAADPDSARREAFARFWGLNSVYADYRELLQKEAIDVLSICAPSGLHTSVLEDAARQGVQAVLCEKPLALDLAEALQAWYVALEAGTLLLVNYSRRWNPSLDELAKDLRAGRWGMVKRASVFYAGGIVGNGTHALDLVHWLIGCVTTVRALGRIDPADTDPPLDALCQVEGGVPCLLQACDPRNFSLLEIDILTSQGRVRVTHNGRRIETFRAAPDAHFPAYRLLNPEPGVRETQWQGCLPLAVADLIACLESGGKPKCGGREAIEALRAATAIRLSAWQDGKELMVSAVQDHVSIPDTGTIA